MAILLLILKIILIIVIVLLVLIFVLLSIKIKYNIDIDIDGKKKLYNIRFSYLMNMLKLVISKEEGFFVRLTIFNITIVNTKTKKDKKNVKSIKINNQDNIVSSIEKNGLVIYDKSLISDDNIKLKKLHCANTSKKLLSDFKKQNIIIKKKDGVFKKFADNYKKLKNSFLETIKQKVLNLINFFKELTSEETIKFIKLIIEILNDLLNKLKPENIKADLMIGHYDPFNTSMILIFLVLLKPIFRNQIKITPNFKEQILKGTIKVNGFVYLRTIAYLLIKLFSNKKFRQLFLKKNRRQ